jgi:DNA (cytosine-5)-methyltransferase 1
MNYIDLFAGAGGLSEGFLYNGFTPIAHIEMNSAACETLKTRIGYYYLKGCNRYNQYLSYLEGKITREDFLKLIPASKLNTVINESIGRATLDTIFDKIDALRGNKQIDVLIGGPPCQAYSLIGRSRDPNRMKGDKRNFLYRYYAEFLKRYRPEYFVFENVTGLLTASDYFESMKELFESDEVGYRIAWKILDSSDYGVLQTRRRIIIVGRKGKRSIEFPIIPKIANSWHVKRDLFADLPALSPGQEVPVVKYKAPPSKYLNQFEIRNGCSFVTQHVTRAHNSRDLEIYALAIELWINKRKRLRYDELPQDLQTHKNITAFHDRFKVVDGTGLSHTMVAHIAKDGHYYIYPDLKQIRSLSVREAARIQSFPDDFYFEGGRTAAFKQIGNAVPPLMARAIASKMMEIILS